MIIGIPKERRVGELRVAASPDTAKRLIGQGHTVVVERGAGAGAAYTDDAYAASGAQLADTAAALGAEIVLKVQRPTADEIKAMKSGAVLVAMLAPLQHKDEVQAYAKAGVTAFAMELVPRITRAQTMDVLSSQANLAGYKAVLDAADYFGRAMPMMMTAAGTVAPARVLVMGAGVAGLQAIATARRLGGVVSATDVRFAAKEQVESLGATFLTVDLEAMKAMETAGGYAKEASEDFTRRQREHVTEALKKIDIVICTALIPGRKAPILITKEMVGVMRAGSVIVDLAVEQGGNVEGSKPDETVTTANGVAIIGHSNMPARIAVDASALYARNLFAFLGLIVGKDKALKIDEADEIVKASLLTRDGKVVHPQLAGA
ncbi:MAG: Re/Si-specific NAD(P)(+) transhydrogenase subunit alpha [Alphaproteobacteria bacterium]|nr:Re/Si-specific NAD(P)(+) transhydrogenase subunit alpha [Alphaproteobacteria bacterium]MDE1967655.1 Re/Si-specific NAD(P)(+) transhydrogenase subunit alpha [Alphaproteobacteria bacterium]MDE2513677.1 Re/Si-specific NAD(P)(+) transhydrogenase subunit alpha [Alphaproteobacteria bacterium]